MVTLIKKLINFVLSPLIKFLDFPVVPPEIAQILDVMLDYFKQGMYFVNIFISIKLMFSLLSVVVILEGIHYGYKLVYWVLTKIPFIGVD